jgi:hypothetical protein
MLFLQYRYAAFFAIAADRPDAQCQTRRAHSQRNRNLSLGYAFTQHLSLAGAAP